MTEKKIMAAALAAPQAPAPRAQKQSDAPKASQSSSSSTSQTSSAAPKKSHDVAKKAGILAILGSMGPGILTAFAGNDAGGIATYSTTGASYGFGMLWTVPLMCLLLIPILPKTLLQTTRLINSVCQPQWLWWSGEM